MDEPVNRLKSQTARAQELYEQGLRRASELTRAASEKSQQALSTTDEWVRENPWLALGIAAGAGLLLGVLVAQAFAGRSKSEAREEEEQ